MSQEIKEQSGKSDRISIKLNDRVLSGEKNRSLLAILYEAGEVQLNLSRQIKEPRGAFCGMGICYECQVEVNGKKGVRSCMTIAEDGMEVKTDA